MDNVIRLSLDVMLDSISIIEEYVQGIGFEDYRIDRKRKIVIAENFETIFQAIANIPTSFREQNLQIPWKELEDLRQKIISRDKGIDEHQLWDAAKNHILKARKGLSELI